MLKIQNASNWPEWFVQPVCNWIVQQAGIDWDYTIQIYKYKPGWEYRGSGRKKEQISRIGRRVYRAYDRMVAWKYFRYADSPVYVLHSRLEVFVALIAHECFHATGGHPAKWTNKETGRCNEKQMEFACDRFAFEIVLKFREAWPELVKQIRDQYRPRRLRRTASTLGGLNALLSKLQATGV